VTTALAIILATIGAAFLLGVFAGRRVRMNLEEWTVGGRRFGVILMWLLMAGEIYTTFTFLGASGWAYSRGAPAFYILIYGTLAYTLSFFILPPLWRVGKRYGLQTQPDFFLCRYESPALGVLVALIGVFSILPYLQLQLRGLGLIVTVASRGAVGSGTAIGVAFVLSCAFVYTSGLRGVAWVAILKDVMMLAAVGIVGIGVPLIYCGGVGEMFRQVAARFPGHLVLPGATTAMDVRWVMSTCVLTGLGFYMWPHVFSTAYSAKSDQVIKRNAIIMPIYQLPILLVFFVGFTALLALPGLKNGDLAFLELVQRTYPPWFMGFVGAAGAVTAMVPAAILVLYGATLLAKNVYRAALRPQADEASVLRVSRGLVLVLMVVALALAILLPMDLVSLLILGYDGVAQFFPGVVLGLFWKRASRVGVLAGLVAGVGIAGALILTGRDPLWGLNAGFVGLAANSVIVMAVSWLRRAAPSPATGA
jgi:SSS family solute:Na+ symporter